MRGGDHRLVGVIGPELIPSAASVDIVRQGNEKATRANEKRSRTRAYPEREHIRTKTLQRTTFERVIRTGYFRSDTQEVTESLIQPDSGISLGLIDAGINLIP